jgi:hypothetical protein
VLLCVFRFCQGAVFQTSYANLKNS